ncbi:GNAT family N-acetyltransferase [Nocardia fluminea]|uniref:GNAT family N-acetyltransferase n=1 Tax=Nocardia fluminea TaxID=134984 RepID=UPI003417D25B
MRTVSLILATESDMKGVATWIGHPEILRWLGTAFKVTTPSHGDSDLDGQPRGHVRTVRLVVRDHDRAQPPVAYACAAIYGTPAPGTVVGATEPEDAEYTAPFHASVMYAVRPDCWEDRIGTALVPALLKHAELAEAAVFLAGIDSKNEGSRKVAEGAGFVAEPDAPATGHRMYRFTR